MKKKLTLALLASLALTTGVAFAADFATTVDGNVTLQYRNDNKKTAAGVTSSPNGFRGTITINTNTKVADGLTFYSRFNTQNNGQSLNGVADDYANVNYNTAFDAFGLKYTTGGWNWTVGSQALTIGAQGLVYDNGFVGRHALPYAVSGAGKLGVINTSVYYAKTNYQTGMGGQDKFYGTNLSYDLNSAAKVGVFYTHWTPASDWATTVSGLGAAFTTADAVAHNAYGLDYSYQFDKKLGFAAEYAKTNATHDNKAYIAGFSYAASPLDTFGAKYYRSEGLSQIWDKNFWGMGTTPNPDTKGYIVSYNRVLSKVSSIGLSHDSEKLIKGTYNISNRDRTRLTYNINF